MKDLNLTLQRSTCWGHYRDESL